MKTASVSLALLAGVWQERVEKASVRFGMLSGVWQERIKKASVSFGVLAGVCQEHMKTASVNPPSHPAIVSNFGRLKANPCECLQFRPAEDQTV